MEGIINIRVNGYSIVKDNNCAGAQFEANSTKLRIEFSEDWDGFTKTVTFWNALGSNPVKVILTDDLLEDKTQSTRVYLVPVAGEAMTEAGMFPFTIDGYIEGVRKRTVEDTLKVLPSRNVGEPQDPTPTQAEQLQKEIDGIKAGKVGLKLSPTGAEAFNDYENNASNIPYSHVEGRNNTGTIKVFLITSYTENTVMLDSVEGIEAGQMWNIFILEDGSQVRYSGNVASVSGNTVTITSNTEADKNSPLNGLAFTPATEGALFATFIVNGGSIGSAEVVDTTGDFSSHIEGINSFATLDAHAEGCNTQAQGYASHTEGKKTNTVGECSHAECYGTKAIGIGSHAEGGSSQAIGYYSHAEGGNTVAKGKCSHSEGEMTEATGNYAHSEGKSTYATGESAHAEGSATTADGTGAHAEGSGTTASAAGAHAEGGSSNATAPHAHAEGAVCNANGEASHAEGGSTTASAIYAHAEGSSTEATKIASHAEGNKTHATGNYAHAEGNSTTASGEASHAEGASTKATNKRAHAEGSGTTASGLNSHAEGGGTTASGGSAHAEGESTIASNSYSHAEGLGTKASSSAQHVQGKYNVEDAAGVYADIVGNGTSDTARSNAYTLDWQGNGRYTGKVYAESDKELATKAALDANVAGLSSSKADRSEVLSKTNTESFAPTADYQPATKKYVDDSVAEAGGGDMLRNVYDTDQSGIVDDAERLGGQLPDYYAKQTDMDNKPIQKGSGVASAIIWNDEGEAYGGTMKPSASGIGSFAAGFETSAAGDNATAFGSGTQAKGDGSIACGSWAVANGVSSAAFGDSVTANAYQTVVGKWNKEYAGATGNTDTTGSAFIVGSGAATGLGNAFRVTFDGHCYGQNAFAASGADYAEYFEWADGNPDNEDRRGYFVTLEGSKIRKATAEDAYILGIVSATPVIEGNAYTDQWQGMYLTDVFGERLTEVAEVPDTTDERTGRVIPAHTETRFILNPDYDDSKAYLGRNERPEWSAVGIVGQLVVIDDGSCEANGFCRITDGGTATKADASTPYRVMERLDETHVRVFVK